MAPETAWNIPMVAAAASTCDGAIDQALRIVRRHLGMDVAYVSEFVDELSVLRRVHAPGRETLVRSGVLLRLDEAYCRHIEAGRLPELIPDTAADPFARSLPVTTTLPIGAHVGAPIQLSDGTVYGMMCCLNFTPNPTLDRRGLETLRLFAEFVAVEIDREQATRRQGRRTLERIEAVLAASGPRMVFQPIHSVGTPGRIAGCEALSRFPVGMGPETPDRWFAEADAVGRRIALETAAVRNALEVLDHLPPSMFVAINASPRCAASREFAETLPRALLPRIVLEITEEVPIDDYDALLARLAPLRRDGLRLAIDDAGAGCAGLKHMLELRPDILKLDAGLVRGIVTDRVRQALVESLVGFAERTGSVVLAEGIETAAELAAVDRLGVGLVQGYHIGRPVGRELLPARRFVDA